MLRWTWTGTVTKGSGWTAYSRCVWLQCRFAPIFCNTSPALCNELMCCHVCVKMAFLVYIGTTGSDSITHIVSDPVATPAELETSVTEKLTLVPTSFFVSSHAQLMTTASTVFIWSEARQTIAGITHSSMMYFVTAIEVMCPP